jgi:excisionase family DNA binding protein
MTSFDHAPLLTVTDVAELLRLTKKGVYAMVEARRIPFIRVSNRLRFRRSDVLGWLEKNRVPSLERK